MKIAPETTQTFCDSSNSDFAVTAHVQQRICENALNQQIFCDFMRNCGERPDSEATVHGILH